MFWITLILWVVAMVLSEVLRPKPKVENARPAHLGDFNFPTATEGRVVPLVWGTVKLDGPNVVWYGDLKKTPIKETVKSGMFSHSTFVKGYKYKIGFQLGLCRGEVDRLETIWVGEKKLWEGQLTEAAILLNKPNFLGGEEGNGGIKGTFRFYPGTRTQLPNSYLAQEPAAYLWTDNFMNSGNAGQSISEFRGTDPNTHYRVTNNGSLGGFGPAGTLTTGHHFVTGQTPVHIYSTFAGGAPGDTDRYAFLLNHPDRPRLADNIKIHMTFRSKDPFATDFGSHEVWMGCKCDDIDKAAQYGVFVIINNWSSVEIKVHSPSSGGIHSVVILTAPTDFAAMTSSTHEVTLHVQGTLLTLFLDGSELWSGTYAPISTIPDDFQGFVLGAGGNLNLEYGGGTDWSPVGIYEFNIDSLLRSLTSNVPAYRGTCYGVFEKGYIGNSTQIDAWSFQVRRVDAIDFLELGDHAVVNEFDANPMNVLFEVLTDIDWGLGFSEADIDLDSFTAAAETLWAEGNGWSMVVDNVMDCAELVREIERQVDGYLYNDRLDGKWKITLARNDYVVEDLPVLNDDNVLERKDFTRGAWEETTNNVRVEFANRENSYQVTYAQGQDSANVRIQNGQMISVTSKYPGVKSKNLANQIAWRDLRAQSYPLSKASLAVDRSFHGTNPGDVLLWSDPELNITELPMRVTRVDLGSLDDGIIVLNLVQDVFGFELPSMAPPDNTQWLDPSLKPPATIEPEERLVFEAPYRFTLEGEGTGYERVYVAARDPLDGSGGFQLWTRDAGEPEYELGGDVAGYALRANLVGDLGINGRQGEGTLDIGYTIDTKDDLLEILETHSPRSIGRSLFNMLLVDDEFIAYQSYEDLGGTIRLTGLYRGLFDTVPAEHAEDAVVTFLIGNVTDATFLKGGTAEIKLLPTNLNGTLDISLAAPSSVTMTDRARRPLPPARPLVNRVEGSDTTQFGAYSLQGTSGYFSDEDIVASLPEFDFTSSVIWGFRFQVDTNGLALGVRFFKESTAFGTDHIGKLFTDAGDVLAAVTFVGESDSGWQYATFDQPVSLTTGTYYRVGVRFGNGIFSRNQNVFQFASTSNHLIVGADGGAWHEGGDGDPSRASFDSGGVDLLFLPGSTIPARGVEVRISRRDFRNTNEIDALYEDNLAVDFPAANSTVYQATVTDDADVAMFTEAWNTGERDIILTRSKILRYAPNVSTSTIQNFFGSTVPPTTSIHHSGHTTVQAGIRFSVDVAGKILGVRFYKGNETDFGSTHTAYLWDGDGTLMATADYDSETGSGFQTVYFDSPVDVTTGVEYRVSVLYPTCYTARHDTFLTGSVTVNHITTPANGGVYIFDSTGYPTNTEAANPWADPIFEVGDTETGIPNGIKVSINAKHTFLDGVEYTAQMPLVKEVALSAAGIVGDFKLGTLSPSQGSNDYTVVNTGTITVRLDAALPSGAVQYRLNGGSWTSAVAATNRSGTFSATAGDVLRLRHTQTGLASSEAFLEVLDGTSSTAWGVLVLG